MVRSLITVGGWLAGLALLAGCATQQAARSTGENSTPAPKARHYLAAPKDTASVIAAPSASVTRPAPPDDSAIEKIAQAHAHYAAGIIHEMNDEEDAALDEYYRAALDDPANESLILDVTRRFIQKKQPEKALDILLAATARPDASGAVFARLGLVYGHLGKITEAVAADRKAIARDPRAATGYQNLFVTLMQNKRGPEALKVLEEAVRQNVATAEFNVTIGELYANYAVQFPSQKSKIRPRALEVLDRALQTDPQDTVLRLHLAEAYDVVGAPEKAATIYLRLLKTLPDVPVFRDQIHAKLASLFMRVSDRTNAIAQLKEITRNDPTNPQLYYYLGFLSYGDKKPNDAIEYFNKAIILKPDYAEAFYQLALAQLSLNQGKDALGTLEKARKISPPNFLLEFYTGLALGEQKDYAAALRHFTTAEVLAKASEPKLLDREFYFQLGACCERTGDYPRAEEYFHKCLELSPDWPEACNYLGYMWADRGTNLDQARVLIERAVKAEPKNAAYLDSLGWVLYKQNQPQQALKQIDQAVKLSEKPDPTLLDHLGDVLSALHETQKARAAWEKSLSLEPNDSIRKKLEAAPAE